MITSLQKEKLKLNHQLCGLMQELQEIKLALQQTKNEASDVEKQSAKQIVELSSMLKELNVGCTILALVL